MDVGLIYRLDHMSYPHSLPACLCFRLRKMWQKRKCSVHNCYLTIAHATVSLPVCVCVCFCVILTECLFSDCFRFDLQTSSESKTKGLSHETIKSNRFLPFPDICVVANLIKNGIHGRHFFSA